MPIIHPQGGTVVPFTPSRRMAQALLGKLDKLTEGSRNEIVATAKLNGAVDEADKAVSEMMTWLIRYQLKNNPYQASTPVAGKHVWAKTLLDGGQVDTLQNVAGTVDGEKKWQKVVDAVAATNKLAKLADEKQKGKASDPSLQKAFALQNIINEYMTMYDLLPIFSDVPLTEMKKDEAWRNKTELEKKIERAQETIKLHGLPRSLMVQKLKDKLAELAEYQLFQLPPTASESIMQEAIKNAKDCFVNSNSEAMEIAQTLLRIRRGAAKKKKRAANAMAQLNKLKNKPLPAKEKGLASINEDKVKNTFMYRLMKAEVAHAKETEAKLMELRNAKNAAIEAGAKATDAPIKVAKTTRRVRHRPTLWQRFHRL